MSEQPQSRIATCACGGLKVTASGPPLRIYACSCRECQKRSASVFTYSAWFPSSAVSIAGEYRSWRRSGLSGRWSETSFCPTCGVSVFGRIEARPDDVGIGIGCFADASFEPPSVLVWSSRKHTWLELPGVAAIDEQ